MEIAAMDEETRSSEFRFMPFSAWGRAASALSRIVASSFGDKEIVRAFFSSSFRRSASLGTRSAMTFR